MSIVFPRILGRAPSSAWSRSVTFFFSIYYLDDPEHLHYDDGEVYDDNHDDLEHLHNDEEKVISLMLV